MAAPKGNQFWKARSSHGVRPIFSDPEKLRDACEQYFQWVQNNPLQEEKVFVFQGNVTRANVSKMRAMTIGGLCLFIGIDGMTWRAYKAKDGLSAVVREIEMAIREQKFTGAAADLLNSNIIARDLGLSEKQELTGKDGGPISVEDVTNDAASFSSRMARLAERSVSGGNEPSDGSGESSS